MNRKIGLYILAVIIVLAIAYGFVPKPVPVDTAEVIRGRLRVTVEEEGKTRVVNRYVISSPVSGYAERTRLDVGDTVQKGQMIIELEPLRSNVLDPRSRAEAAARVSAAEAEVSSAKENVYAAKAIAKLAKKELERAVKLFGEGMVSREMLDIAETELRRTEAALHSAEFELEVGHYEKIAAQAALQYSAARDGGKSAEKVIVKSPVNGRILKVYHESEGAVREGKPLLEIGDPSSLEIEVDVLSEDAVKIRPGMNVLFERWGGDSSLEGKVRIVEPAGFTKISALGVEEQRVLVISDIVSSPDEWVRLGDGYRVEVSFVLWEKDDVLQAPSSALFRYGKDRAVFVMENGRADLRRVRLGHRNGLVAEIVSGLSEGEMVITHPDSSIEDGSHVKLRKY